MDNKRLFLAVVLSVAILVGFEWLMPKQSHPVLHRQAQQSTHATPAGSAPRPVTDLAPPGTQPAAIAPLSPDARLPIDATRIQGSIDLVGARLDDLVLRDYQETIKPGSPHVRVLEPQDQKQPNLVQLGWSSSGTDVKVPDGTTLWTADQPKLTPETPVTLSWENGAGLTFQIALAVDRNYMFTIEQRVRNTTGQPVSLYPWSRISRSYTPQVTGGYLVHEGPIAVVDGRLEEMSYTSLKSKAAEGGGTGWSALQASGPDGGWGGITDKYWLTAIIPGHDQPVTASYRYQPNDGAGTYQVDFISQAPMVVAAGAIASTASHVFAGAKEVHLLEAYQTQLHATDFWKAVDFGWFAFLTKPIFYVLDWLNTALGNFGLALLAFTLIVKTLFFPLAIKQFRSMGKMKLLTPKMTAVRERHKGDAMAMNTEMMALYKQEGVNPASGCLPMLVQIPVFWCLYKDLVVTIEMRHAPFFGWIRDLSEPDPTNIFNLFGLIPFDPGVLSPFLHLGVWPIVLGGTMLLMQKLNPPPPDPMQARLFQLMPLIFMFVLARQPAGLVIYYCWNNLLTVSQQWLIQRRTHLGGSRQVSTVSR
ncbi:membrane protein insertase YidC [Lichenicola cladoniae]|uniref:Membrane protein insertase YidC n=1 Tax=Lichenicola cladoniae TaxID=1484109 RepID=A0A6M8HPC8_9PROT|nr:membrane protein insertase YidC [Lichenicola cladoniae]NPD66449.1 membrane protein insertase YidC [Acetobacteraceae bacterium]QKE90319.1 membrane protein insertase YidC [Lichenicola cladoniae]